MCRDLYRWISNVLDSDIGVDGTKRNDHRNEVTHQCKIRNEEKIWRLVQV